MSYGNWNIAVDLDRGFTIKEVSKKINERYPDISLSRAYKIAQKIKRFGADVKIDWRKK